MAPSIFFFVVIFSFLFIFFKYETIETHTRKFLSLDISAGGSVKSLKLSNFQNFNEIDKNTNFAKLPSTKWLFLYKFTPCLQLLVF